MCFWNSFSLSLYLLLCSYHASWLHFLLLSISAAAAAAASHSIVAKLWEKSPFIRIISIPFQCLVRLNKSLDFLLLLISIIYFLWIFFFHFFYTSLAWNWTLIRNFYYWPQIFKFFNLTVELTIQSHLWNRENVTNKPKRDRWKITTFPIFQIGRIWYRAYMTLSFNGLQLTEDCRTIVCQAYFIGNASLKMVQQQRAAAVL